MRLQVVRDFRSGDGVELGAKGDLGDITALYPSTELTAGKRCPQ